MKERVLSGVVLIVFLAAVVLFNSSFPLALNIAVALISALAVYELVKALDLQRRLIIAVPSVLISAFVPFCMQWDITFIAYVVYSALIFIAMLKYNQDITYKEIAVVFNMSVIIPLALRSLVSIRALGGAHGMFYVLIAILSAWIADAGAYFVGTFLGKHKLCPNISPKKTVEGFIGGIVVNVLAMLLCGFIFSQIFYGDDVAKKTDYILLATIGFVAAFASVLGDLSFSLIKRSNNIKDFGNVIPGHGGILDRFDSVIFTAPIVYILITYFPLVAKGIV